MNLHPIFADICSRNASGGRYDLDKPGLCDGWIFATDGAALVRVRAEGITHCQPLGTRMPDVLHLFQPPAKERLPMPLADLRTIVCPHCWTGCPECWNTGNAVGDNQLMCGLWFHQRYLGLLLKYKVPVLEIGENDRVPARFTIGDIEGLVMPMRSPKGKAK